MVKQLYDRKCFKSINMNTLTEEEKKVLEFLTFLQKREIAKLRQDPVLIVVSKDSK